MNPLLNAATSPAVVTTWYLVHCKPRQDGRAEEHLVRQGYACYRPLVSCLKSVGGRRVVVSESLFPGYIFVGASADANWSALRSTRGVNRLVSFGGFPLRVSSDLIGSLKRRPGYTSDPSFVSGDKLRIVEGSFCELDAIFHCMDGEERVVVLMTILHRQQRVTLPLASVRKQ